MCVVLLAPISTMTTITSTPIASGSVRYQSYNSAFTKENFLPHKIHKINATQCDRYRTAVLLTVVVGPMLTAMVVRWWNEAVGFQKCSCTIRISLVMVVIVSSGGGLVGPRSGSSVGAFPTNNIPRAPEACVKVTACDCWRSSPRNPRHLLLSLSDTMMWIWLEEKLTYKPVIKIIEVDSLPSCADNRLCCQEQWLPD